MPKHIENIRIALEDLNMSFCFINLPGCIPLKYMHVHVYALIYTCITVRAIEKHDWS